MPGDPDWRELLGAVSTADPLRVERLVREEFVLSASRPSIYLAEDGNEYVVKLGNRNHDRLRSLASEQVVAKAADLLGAPVPPTTIVQVDEPFLPADESADSAGVAHASLYIRDLSDIEEIKHLAENRDRFGALAVLYTWTRAEDHQVCYEGQRVWSVDHGMFLPPANNWTAAELAAYALPTEIDSWFDGCGLTGADIADALQRLTALSPSDVAAAAKAARPEWGVTDAEHKALCQYLWDRRSSTISALSARG